MSAFLAAVLDLCAVAGTTVWTASPMARVTPVSAPPPGASTEVSISLARRERESAQVLVTCDADTELRSVSLVIDPLRFETVGSRVPRDRDELAFSGSVKWERIGHVPRVPGANPHPNAPPADEKWIPDPLLPVGPFAVERGSTQGAWITVYAAPDAQAGRYRSRIRVRQGSRILATVPLTVRVRDFSLGRIFKLDTAFSLMDGFMRAKYPANWRAMKKQAMDVMLDHRLNPDDISRTTPPEIEDLLHARERGMSRFNILNIVPEPGSNVQWVCTARASELFSDAFYPKFRDRLRPYLSALKAKGLDGLAYVYGFDECRSKYYAGIDVLWRKFKADFPNLPMMTTTTLFRDFAHGWTNSFDCVTTDWYCPVISQYKEAAADRLRARGKKVWWYTCNSPPHPYASISSLEYPPVEGRVLLGCLTWLYRADGFLHWHVNNWRGAAHPTMDESETRFSEWNLKTRMKMPGDGILLYPGREHVLPSIRLANVRDGEEDYEYLALAEAAVGRERVASIVRRHVVSITKFTRNADALAALREQLADAIEGKDLTLHP